MGRPMLCSVTQPILLSSAAGTRSASRACRLLLLSDCIRVQGDSNYDNAGGRAGTRSASRATVIVILFDCIRAAQDMTYGYMVGRPFARKPASHIERLHARSG